MMLRRWREPVLIVTSVGEQVWYLMVALSVGVAAGLLLGLLYGGS
jgi:hypothetical protein